MNIKRHIGRKSPGFILLTVILVGAILLVSALMFVSQLATEGHVAKTDAYFKSALNLAETGLSNAVMDIGGGMDPSGWGQKLESGSYDFGTTVVAAVHGTYEVALTVQNVSIPDPTHPYQRRGEVLITSTGRVYPPSVATADMQTGSTGYVARRAVRMSTSAMWTVLPTWTTETVKKYGDYDIKYGIYTGGNLTLWGSSKEVQGDVFANGWVLAHKNDSVVSPGEAYAVGSVTGLPGDRSNAGAEPIPFPVINMDGTEPGKLGYRVLYDAYVTGKAPYDGTVAGYPNTNSGTFLGAKYRVDWGINALLAASVPSGVTDPNDATRKLLVLPAGDISAAVSAAMINPDGVYLFGGSVTLPKKDVTAAWSGTVVIDGDFSINSNITVGGATPVNLLVNGNVIKDNGCSEINGVLYTNGTYTGNGTAALYGALLSRDSVYLNGTLDVTYNPDLGPIGGLISTETTKVPGDPLYSLDAFTRAASGKRGWQEVDPQD